MGQRAGPGHRLGPGVQPPEPGRRRIRPSVSTACRYPGARRSTRPRRSTAPMAATSTSAAATPPRPSTVATTRTRPVAAQVWNQVVTNPPTDTMPDGGVQASLALGDGGSLVEGGSLGQMTYALLSGSGAPATGWPQFSADSVFSTAAAGDLYGTGSDTFVSGGASSSGFAYGKSYANGGHVRIWNDHGGLVCSATTNEEVDSSPAVGPILPGGRTASRPGRAASSPVPATRTRSRCSTPGATRCGAPRWTDSPAGAPPWPTSRATGSWPWSKARTAGGSGSVWALNSASGATIWKTPVLGAVIGSVTTADLTGAGYQDVIVPTVLGSRSSTAGPAPRWPTSTTGRATPASPPGAVFGFQNAPLVTAGRQRVDRDHGGRVLRHRGRRRAGRSAALRGGAAPARSTPSRRAGGPSSTTTPR